jgi:hypothetical protein
MEKAGFRPDDPLYQLVDKAYSAVHHLPVHVHYLACDADRELKAGSSQRASRVPRDQPQDRP